MLRNKGVFQKLSLGLSAVFMLMVLSPNAVWAENYEETCKTELKYPDAEKKCREKNNIDTDKGIKKLQEEINKLNNCQTEETEASLSKKLECGRNFTEKTSELDRKKREIQKKLESCLKELNDNVSTCASRKEAEAAKAKSLGIGNDISKDDKKAILENTKKSTKQAYEQCKKDCKENNGGKKCGDADIQRICDSQLKAYRQAEYDVCMVEKGGNADKCKKQMNQLAAVAQDDSNEAIKEYNRLMQEAADGYTSCLTSGSAKAGDDAYVKATTDALKKINMDLLNATQKEKIETQQAKVKEQEKKCTEAINACKEANGGTCNNETWQQYLSGKQQEAQEAANKAFEAAQAATAAAQDAYDQCLKEKTETDCAELKANLEAAKAAEANAKKTADTGGDNDGEGGAVGGGSGAGGGAVRLVDEDVYKAEGTDNIFGKVARRAAFVLISLKKIIYLIAGFGLIGFAWMAVFGKISWKWFGNLVISLFLVANVGRFIEYFVYTNPESQTHEALIFKDFLLSDILDGADPNVAYNASAGGGGKAEYKPEGVDLEGAEESNNKKTKGFCSGNNGTGWSNFTNCMGDIVSSIKKGADTVKKTANTVNNAINTGKAIVNTAKNIGTAFKNADSFGDVMNAIGTAASGSASIMNMTMNTASDITNNIGDIANNIQDIGKSREEQAELEALRRSGQSTNAIAGAMDAVDGVLDKGKEVTGMASDGLGAIGSASNAVGGLATNIDNTFGITAGKEAKKREQEQAAREEKRKEEEKLRSEDNALSGFGQTTAATEKAKQEEKKACEADPNSAACKQATASRELAEAKEKEAKGQADAAYERQRQAEIEAAKKAKEEAEARQQDACKDPDSVACKQANLDVLKSQEQYDNANNKPKTFDESQEKKQEGKEANAASEPTRAPQYAPQSTSSVASAPEQTPQYAPQSVSSMASEPEQAPQYALQNAPAMASDPTATPNSIATMAGTPSVAAPAASAEAYDQERQARITAAQNVQQESQQAYSLAESKSKKLETVAGNAQKEAETAAAKAQQMMDAAKRNGNANQYKEAQRLQQEAETKAAEAQKAQAALDEAKQEKEKAEENLKDAKQQEEAAVSAPVYVEYMHQQAADIANNLMARADEAKQAMERAQKLLKSNKSRAAQIAAANAKAAYEEALAKAENAQKKADALKAK